MAHEIPWSPSAATWISKAVPRSAYGRGVAYALGAGIALGILGPVSTIAYAAGMSSPTFAALRATIGALAVALVVRAGRHPTVPLASLPRREASLLALTSVAQAALSLSLFAAYGQMAVALVLAVYFSYPLIVACASIALGRERLTRSRGAALAVSGLGLVAVILGGTGGLLAPTLAGLALAGIAAVCQATYLVASRAGFTRVPSDQATAVILGGAAALMWLVAIPYDAVTGRAGVWLPSPVAWSAVLLAGVVGAAVAKVCMLRGVRRVGGTRASVLMLSEPLTGAALAGVLLGQGLAPAQLLGGVAVLAGAGLAQRPAPGPAAPKRAPAPAERGGRAGSPPR